jgi:LysM repeat protein
MSTPNPLMPEGSLQPSKGKSNVRIAVFTILAIHGVLLGGLLMQGCKRENKTAVVEPTDATATAATTTTVDPSATPSASQDPTTAAMDTSIPAANLAPVSTGTPSGNATTLASTPIPTAAPSRATAAPSVAATTTPFAASDGSVAPVTGDMKTHTVARGESYSTIAKKYSVTAKAIEDANPGVNPVRLQINQKLSIPAPSAAPAVAARADGVAVPEAAADGSTYVVKSGDALEKIARSHGTNVKTIKAMNNLRTDRITVGQKLKLPAKTPATLEASAAPTTTAR